MCLAAAFGCHAQTKPASKSLSPAQLDHRIEVIVRSQFDLPSDVVVHIEHTNKSDVSGYHIVNITLTQDARTSEVFPFEISDDLSVIGRFERFDLTVDPKNNVAIEGRPIRGAVDAPVTIVVFDDLECPYCSQMYQQLFPGTLDHYKGEVRIIYKDFPLSSIHPWAMHAAVDSNCLLAQSQPAYWGFVEYAHTHADQIPRDQKPDTAYAALDKQATDEGTRQNVNLGVLQECLARQDISAIQASIDEGKALKLEATPTLFVNGEKVEGAIPKDQLWQMIDRALKAEGVAPPAEK